MRAASLAVFLVLAACGGSTPEAEAQHGSPPAQAAPAPTPPPATDPSAPQFGFPVACTIGRDCEVQRYMDRDPGPQALDYRCGEATNDGHEGVDIRLPDMAAQARGVNVLAAADGTVLRTRDGVDDISSRVVGAENVTDIGCGNAVVIDHGHGWSSVYCHMAKGSVRVNPGDPVKAGQPVGAIGLSGLTEFPHLHFTVVHNQTRVDPFGPGPVSRGACPAQPSLWKASAARQFAYKPATILNAGFSGGTLVMEQLERAEVMPVGDSPPVLVAYMRAIMMRPGDALELSLTGPKGEVLAQATTPPMANARAQQLQFIGKKRPATGWPPGVYRAQLRVVHDGQVLAEKRVETRL
jgi:murein DD-endopeptidase MepM/ murein hydrolase activator NlpD